MNAQFFVLAFTAALNPKFLAIDLLLIENRRPRAMFLCVLIGGLTADPGVNPSEGPPRPETVLPGTPGRSASRNRKRSYLLMS